MQLFAFYLLSKWQPKILCEISGQPQNIGKCHESNKLLRKFLKWGGGGGAANR